MLPLYEWLIGKHEYHGISSLFEQKKFTKNACSERKSSEVQNVAKMDHVGLTKPLNNYMGVLASYDDVQNVG
jgi:hypothetical protein